MRRQALGRGLDALIGGVTETGPEQDLLDLRPDQITPSRRQPRRVQDEAGIDELAASIAEHGLLQPVIVRPPSEDGKYELVAGERRWRAAQRAGVPTVPAIVWEASERESLELALVENLQREDLPPLDCARAFRTLIDEFGLTQEAVAARVGKSRSAVANTLRLLGLPEAAQMALDAGQISEGHARALLAIDGIDLQLAALRVTVEKGLSVRETERLAKRYQGPQRVPRETARRRRSGETDPHLADIETKLRLELGTMVRVIQGPKKGTIEIEYYSDEDLDRILSIILRQH
jgi:ParB family chromosome partitioning protein